MAAQVSICLPRLLVLGLIALLGSATATIARRDAEPAAERAPLSAAAPAAPVELVVPDMRGRAYVFAKSALEEGGFTWQVVGPVKGYPANLVVGQQPAPGTRVVDTGAPTIVLELARNAQYSERGEPENASPYPGTPIRPVPPEPDQ